MAAVELLGRGAGNRFTELSSATARLASFHPSWKKKMISGPIRSAYGSMGGRYRLRRALCGSGPDAEEIGGLRMRADPAGLLVTLQAP